MSARWARFLAHLADIVGLSFLGPRFISLSCLSLAVADYEMSLSGTPGTTLSGTAVVPSGAEFTFASVRATLVTSA